VRKTFLDFEYSRNGRNAVTADSTGFVLKPFPKTAMGRDARDGK